MPCTTYAQSLALISLIGALLFLSKKRHPNQICARDLGTSLEGAFLDGNCLIGVVLWGNSGEGVSIVCPDQEGYAEEVSDLLRKELSNDPYKEP